MFVDSVGEQVASPLVTLVDDGTMGPEWGSFAIDDEGHAASRNVLIDKGILTDYMWDYLRRAQGGKGLVGKRQTSELPAPSHGEDDEHLLDERRVRS